MIGPLIRTSTHIGGAWKLIGDSIVQLVRTHIMSPAT